MEMAFAVAGTATPKQISSKLAKLLSLFLSHRHLYFALYNIYSVCLYFNKLIRSTSHKLPQTPENQAPTASNPHFPWQSPALSSRPLSLSADLDSRISFLPLLPKSSSSSLRLEQPSPRFATDLLDSESDFPGESKDNLTSLFGC